MSITDVRVQVPPRAPRSTGGLPSGGTPQRGDTGSKVHIDARVVELADSLDSGSSVHYGRAGSSPASRTKWTKVGVLNSFLRLSNTPTLVLWEKALIFEALPFLMYSLVIHIAKIKVARLVVENRKKPSFEPFVQINLLTLSFAHGAIRTHPVSCG